MLKVIPLLIFLLTLTGHAQLGLGAKRNAKPVTSVELTADVASVAPGDTFTAALTLNHPSGWHSYYLNPGVIGVPLAVEWTLPDGFEAKRVGWPAPHKSEMLGFQTFGYEGSVTHLFAISTPQELPADIKIVATPTWQICSDTSCLSEPQNGQPTQYTLTLNAGETLPNPAAQTLVQKARSNLPGATDSWAMSAADDGQTITLTVTLPDGLQLPDESPFFYDQDGQVSSQDTQTFEKTDTGFTLSFLRNLSTPLLDEPGPVLPELTGVLSFEQSHQSYSISTPFDSSDGTGAGSTAEKEAKSISSIIGTIALLFIGGLLLNLMPCVFPVIGLKIMGFVQQAGHDKRKIVLHGILFAAGVIISFWVLSAMLYFGGISNWGSQLEDPRVIVILLIVMLLLAMNMFGIFEIGTSATSIGGTATNKDGLLGTFLSGVLATVIATPCAGPFLGAAIGIAVTLPGFLFFLAFTAMAVGLALPYLIFSFFPDLICILPRPGAWMTSFKQGMSFLLFATVGFLLWIYSNQVFDRVNGLKGLFVVLGLTAIATAAWIYGRWSVPGKSSRVIWASRSIAVIFAIVGTLAAWPFAAKPSGWQSWSPELQQAAIAEGRPVFVDFTAKWCLTCQSNKATAYTEDVKALIKDKNVLLLKADKTTSNPVIDAELSRLGRSALPVNVFYAGGEKTITPEVLTPGVLKELFSVVTP